MHHHRTICVAVLASLLAAPAARAETVADFYRGKTISVIIGYSPGGGLRHLCAARRPLHRPLHPRKSGLAAQQMPGGGSRIGRRLHGQCRAARRHCPCHRRPVACRAAGGRRPRPSCSTPASSTGSAIRRPGQQHACRLRVARRQDRRRRQDQGDRDRRDRHQYLVAICPGAEFGRRHPNSRSCSATQARWKWGFALERGEIGGYTNTWAGWVAEKPDWLRDKKINILVRSASSAMKEMPDVPLLMDVATKRPRSPGTHDCPRPPPPLGGRCFQPPTSRPNASRLCARHST